MQKRKMLLFLFLGFFFLEMTYYSLIQYFTEGNISPSFELSALFLLMVALFYTIPLWDYQSKDFYEIKAKNSDKLLFAFGEILMISSSLKAHYKYLPYFETNKLLFVGLGALDIIAITIFVYLIIKGLRIRLYLFENKHKN